MEISPSLVDMAASECVYSVAALVEIMRLRSGQGALRFRSMSAGVGRFTPDLPRNFASPRRALSVYDVGLWVLTTRLGEKGVSPWTAGMF